MDSQQQSLFDDNIAQELAENQKEISIAEFFEKNKHMLGFDSKSRSIVTAVKEAVDNALDASEEAGILPEISVEITKEGKYYRLVVEDNGPGIAKSSVKNVFGKLLYGSRFHSNRQTRGQQGIGISAAVLYSQKTSGKPAKIKTKTGEDNQAQYLELIIDTDTNEPDIRVDKDIDWDEKNHGTRVELEMEASMRGRKQLLEYIRDTAIVNPHATISLKEPQNDFHSERVTDDLPPETKEIKPHPHGVELGTLQEMLKVTDSYSISGFLQEDFTRVGQKTAESIIEKFSDNFYGREFGWDSDIVLEDEDEFKEGCTNVISRKSPEATEMLVSDIYDTLYDRGYVSHQSVVNTVEDVADSVEDDYDERIGETVRENIVEYVWAFIIASRRDCLYEGIHSVASKRKKDEMLDVIAEELNLRFSDYGGDRLTYGEWVSMVDEAAEIGSDEYGQAYGETAREKVIDEFWDATENYDADTPSVKEVYKSRDMAASLLRGMSDAKVMAPPDDCLAPVEPELIEEGLRKEYDADFYTATKRSGGVHAGSPFIVEAGMAYGGSLKSDSEINLRRFANRVPLVYQPGACSITQTTGSIGWRNYDLKQPGGRGLPHGPVVLIVHVASTNVPFTSESKDAVAQVEEIEFEVEQAIRECARDIKSFSKNQKSLQKRRKKQSMMGELVPAMAAKFASVAGRENSPELTRSIARIMNNVCIYKTDGTLQIDNNTGKNENVTIEIASDDGFDEAVNGLELDDGTLRESLSLSDTDSITVDLSDLSGETVDITISGTPPEKLTHNLSGDVNDSLGEGDGTTTSITYTVTL